LWTISNITAGNPQQIELILENKSYIDKLKTAIAIAPVDVKNSHKYFL